MEASSKRFPITAVDSAGQECTLIITAFYKTYQGDDPADKVTTIDRATCETERGEQLLNCGQGKFRSISSGAEFTSGDPKARIGEVH